MEIEYYRTELYISSRRVTVKENGYRKIRRRERARKFRSKIK
jgi:hypothetical protein